MTKHEIVVFPEDCDEKEARELYNYHHPKRSIVKIKKLLQEADEVQTAYIIVYYLVGSSTTPQKTLNPFL